MLPVSDPLLFVSLSFPLLGAGTGYLVSRITLHQVFKPQRSWSLLGLQLPLTSGILPARRQALAAALAEVLGPLPLTGRELGAALSGAPFQRRLAMGVEGELLDLLDQELGSVSSLVPERFRAYLQVGVKTLKYRLAEGGHDYLMSDGFAAKITATLKERFTALKDAEGNRQPSLEGQGEAMIRECLAFLRSSAMERLVHAAVSTLVDDLLARPVGRLHDLIPHGVQQGLVESLVFSLNRMLAQEFPEVVGSLDVRSMVAERVDALTPRQLERLLAPLVADRSRSLHRFGALLGFLAGLMPLVVIWLA